MKIDFLRHAESVFNANGTSEKDCDLTEKGVEQASQIEGHYDLVFCSIMKRTCKTLDHSKLRYGRLVFTDLCREKRVDICDFLDYEDETKKESDEELDKRIQVFLSFLKSQATKFNSVLVISHGDFIHRIGKGQKPYPNNAEIQTHIV